MTKISKEERVAEIQSKSTILAAVISSSVTLFATLIIAFFAFPPFQEWVQNWGGDSQQKTLTIEQIPFWVSLYSGENDADPNCCAGQGELEYSNTVNLSPEYIFDFIFSGDPSKYNYAGIDFTFYPSQNFAEYRNIEFTITFGDNVNQTDLKLEDIAQNIEPFRLVGSIDSDKAYVVPFSNFTTIDFKAIRAVSFQIDSNIASGNGTITVKNIRFTK